MCYCALVTKHCHGVKVMQLVLVLPYGTMRLMISENLLCFGIGYGYKNGRPRLGHVADIMRRIRAKYHYTVRYIKRCENDRRKRKIAESVSTINQRDHL